MNVQQHVVMTESSDDRPNWCPLAFRTGNAARLIQCLCQALGSFCWCRATLQCAAARWVLSIEHQSLTQQRSPPPGWNAPAGAVSHWQGAVARCVFLQGKVRMETIEQRTSSRMECTASSRA